MTTQDILFRFGTRVQIKRFMRKTSAVAFSSLTSFLDKLKVWGCRESYFVYATTEEFNNSKTAHIIELNSEGSYKEIIVHNITQDNDSIL